MLSQSEELPLSVDKILATSDNSVGVSDESRAEAFAKRLFLIRHQRSELISGDVGEAVFGDGLQAALQRMAEEEEQILKMFVGVTKSTVSRVRFYIKPEADKKTYILARFSQRDGVCDVSGINGAPIYLQVSPMELPKIDEAVPNSKGEFKEPIVQYMIAADASCALYSDVDSITTVILPIFEYGRIYNIAAPKKK